MPDEKAQILAALHEEAKRILASLDDLAHGWEHILRVYNVAVKIAEQEHADVFIVGAAALLHDIGRARPADKRHHAEISVEMSRELLAPYNLAKSEYEGILHAIASHSYKRGERPASLEARVLWDADRLDSIGAIGIFRWAVSGPKKHIPLTYHPEDPFAEDRELNDKRYLLDQFYKKLLHVEDMLTTEAARKIAHGRTQFMRAYLEELREELNLNQHA